MSGGELCLLQHEVDKIELINRNRCYLIIMYALSLIREGKTNEYEKPSDYIELEGQMWKGKADIINHDEKLSC